MSRMCPAYIEVLLHIHVSPERLRTAPVVEDAIVYFLGNGIIAEDADNVSKSGYKTTDRGVKLVDMLCETPLPVLIYKDPREIDDQR